MHFGNISTTLMISDKVRLTFNLVYYGDGINNLSMGKGYVENEEETLQLSDFLVLAWGMFLYLIEY
jgi:hypothetical protein